MPIYTVRETTGDQKADPLLKNRGLEARVVTLTQLDPIAIPDIPQVAYKLYAQLLPAFMLATKNKEVLPTSRPGYNIIEKAVDCIYIPLPPLTVSFKNSLTAEQVDEMKSRGAGIIPNKVISKVMYTFGAASVNVELVNFLYKHSREVNVQCATTQGSCNLATIQAQMKTLGILTWFLKTHVYPAFKGPATLEEGAVHSYDTLEGFVTLKRKAGVTVARLKKPRLDTDVDEEMIEDEEDTDAMIEEMMFGDSASRVPKAKPSATPEKCWGLTSDVPTLPGLVFPYFDGMIAVDTAFVSSVIRQYFLECLGDTRDAVMSGYKDLKLRLGLLASTATGRILQHIFLGVKLAIEGQARLFPIFRGFEYVGFSLHGWYFAISIDGYRHVPLPYEKLVTEVSDIDLHNVALARIFLKLAGMKLLSTGKQIGKKAAIDLKAALSGPRELSYLLAKMRMEESDREYIEEQVAMLSFPQRFWPLDPEHILKAVDLLISKSLPDDKMPLYTRGGTVSTRSISLSIFALFGDQAFSLRIPGGESRKIPKDIASDVLFKPYTGKGGKSVVPRPSIVIGKKNLSLCVEDWNSFMIDRCVHMKQTRDAMFRSVVFGGDKAKKFWHGLIERIGPLDVDVTKEYGASKEDLGEDVINDGEEDLGAFL